MKLNSANHRVSQRLKLGFRAWLLLSIAVMAVVLALSFLFLTKKGVCNATLNFSYNGIESGFNPDGNRFDRAEIKNEKLVRQAAQPLRGDLTDEEVERLQEALEIRGSISQKVFEDLISHNSVYEDNQVAESTTVEAASYFPSQYTVSFHYLEAGFTKQEGLAFLDGLLDAYEQYFYDKYGYNTSLEQSIAAIDYETYDYIDAVDILDERLTSLRVYIGQLNGLDNTRFVSQRTGYSFSDLAGAISTLQEEDIQWVRSYITSNNITKDRNNLIDYYQYRIAENWRILAQQDARLYTLNELINNYVKTNAIFPIIGENGTTQEDTDSTSFEFSQPSQMYDTLINEKINSQTSFSETEENIAQLERRVERLQSGESSGDPAIVEVRLEVIDGKIGQLLENVSQTADEFFKTVWLKRAVQVLTRARTSMGIGSTIRNALPFLLIIEAALFGLYILSALRADSRKNQRTDRARSKEETADSTTAERAVR